MGETFFTRWSRVIKSTAAERAKNESQHRTGTMGTDEAMRARARQGAANIVFNCDDIPPWECDRVRTLLAQEIWDALRAAVAGERAEIERLRTLLLRIDGANDNPSCFNVNVDALLRDEIAAIRGEKP
jgi:hypothetical protein